MLNRVWLFLMLVSIASAFMHTLFLGQPDMLGLTLQAMFDMAKVTVEISIGLLGLICLWQGLFAIAEHAGLIARLSKLVSPLLHKLMPELKRNDPAFGSVTMNLAANMLGLDNAATPLGIRAMQDLQRVNPEPERASNAQILFLVLNTSSITLIPVTVFLYRAQQGAAQPTDVFIPLLIATSASTLGGLFAVSWVQKIRLWDKVVLGYLSAGFALIASVVVYFSRLASDAMQQQSALFANGIILSFLLLILLAAWRKQLPVYDLFVAGAKSGLETVIKIIPYLLAMLVALGALRASGVLELLLSGIRDMVALLGMNTAFVDALPVGMAKPFSGSAARALLLETMGTYGADSFVGRLASVFQGSTETTFYVLAVYFGAVGIRNGRHAIWCGLFADACGIVAAILVSYWFFY